MSWPRRKNPHGLLQPVCDGGLVRLKDKFRVAFAQRSGRRTGTASSHRRRGLMNPNHYLAVAIGYLLTHRPHWPANVVIGKTLVKQRHD